MSAQITQHSFGQECLRGSLFAIAFFATIVGSAIAAWAQSPSAAPRLLPNGQIAAPLPPVDDAAGQSPRRQDFVTQASATLSQPINVTSAQQTGGVRVGLLPAAGPVLPSGVPQPLPPGSTLQSADYGSRSLSAGKDAPNLKAATLEPGDIALPISLATALRLSDARPLIVNAAQASAWVAEAQLQRAKVIKVPEIDIGVAYVRHDGPGPDFNRGDNEPTYLPGLGGPLNQNLNFLYAGGSLWMEVPLTDALFQPLVARQVLNSRRFDIQTAKNDALLITASQYFNVHQYRGQYAGALDVVQRGEKLRDRIVHLSADLVPRVEVDRITNALADMQQHAALARQQWRVSSANLTQVLRLDPRVVIVPLEPDHLQVTLIDPARTLDELMPIAMLARPELASKRAMILAAEQGIRREKYRPVLPMILITGFQSPAGMRMQMDFFALGHGDQMNNTGLRDDVSLQAIWQLDGMGLGNLARIKTQRGQQSRAIVDLNKMQDAAVAEVTQSQADVQSAALRVVQAERSMREAIITYEGNYEGLTQTRRFDNVLIQIYRPQEAAIALEHLLVAYDQYFATVADYNRAQFRFFHALGYPAREVSALRPPGEIQPVNTSRPTYLPPVGIGPPPANR